jgi:hypothetical protein
VSSTGVDYSTSYIFSIARKSGLELNKEKDLHILALENALQFYDLRDDSGDLYLKPAGEYYYKYYSGHGCSHSSILNKNDRMVERGEDHATASFNEIVDDVKDAFRSKGPNTEKHFVMNHICQLGCSNFHLQEFLNALVDEHKNSVLSNVFICTHGFEMESQCVKDNPRILRGDDFLQGLKDKIVVVRNGNGISGVLFSAQEGFLIRTRLQEGRNKFRK